MEVMPHLIYHVVKSAQGEVQSLSLGYLLGRGGKKREQATGAHGLIGGSF
jgi:hypothetical protein